jgi:hypothetical protein
MSWIFPSCFPLVNKRIDVLINDLPDRPLHALLVLLQYDTGFFIGILSLKVDYFQLKTSSVSEST